MKPSTLFFVIGAACAAAVAHAQDQAPKRTCRILFLNAPADAPDKLHLFDGSNSREVELPRFNLSEVYGLAGGPLSLRLLPGPAEDPGKLPPEAPQVEVPAGVVDLYLLLTSDTSNKVAPVRMEVLDAGKDKFRAGQMLWCNLSPNRIVGTVGAQQLSIEPGAKVVLDAPAAGPEDYPVNLVFQMPGEEARHSLCQTQWRHNPRSRSLVIIHVEQGRRVPRVTGFSDYREPAPGRP